MSNFDFEDNSDPWSSVGTISINSKPKNEKELKSDKFNQNKKPVSTSNPFQNNIDNELSGFVELDSNKKSFDPNKEYNPEEEIPLLEELGISTDRIKEKIFSVMTFHKVNKKILEDADMTGPFLIFIVFALSLILQKKTHFGYIYGINLFGGVIISTLMNLMSKKESIMLYNTISVLGYCMIPIVLASFIGVFISLKEVFGFLLCFFAIIGSSITATNFFEEVLNMQSQKWLIFYPLLLFYTCFLLLTVY